MIEYQVKVQNSGTREWYQNGELHREDGSPAIEWSDGGRTWFRNGKLHRTDGPAIESADGSKHWFQDGVRHRTDGPAIERSENSQSYNRWFINGQEMVEEEFNEKTKAKELTVAEIEELLGYPVKIVK